VHAFDSRAEGDIDSVVDQEWHVGRFGDFVQLFGIVDELCCVALFVTVLYNCCAWLESKLVNGLNVAMMTRLYPPPSTAALTTATRFLSPRIAGVESVTRYTE
jgi:hypothetical protein